MFFSIIVPQNITREDSLRNSALVSKKADSLYSKNKFQEAIYQYKKSLSFLSFDDIVDSIIASTVYAGICMSYYQLEDYESAYTNYFTAKRYDEDLTLVVDFPIKKIFRFFYDGWYYLSSNDNLDIYYDKKSIKNNNSYLKVWLKIFWDKDKSKKSCKSEKEFQNKKNEVMKVLGNADYMLQLFNIDCYNHRLRVIDIVFYSEAGDLLERHSDEFSSWENIIPKSYADNVSEVICK
jgi:hypothetical protein